MEMPFGNEVDTKKVHDLEGSASRTTYDNLFIFSTEKGAFGRFRTRNFGIFTLFSILAVQTNMK